ncbi:MAG TPA: hypothetical protein VFX77_05170 [Rubrobacter sp.]|nr:hypothetical protein [Rubrobacter sp.]
MGAATLVLRELFAVPVSSEEVSSTLLFGPGSSFPDTVESILGDRRRGGIMIFPVVRKARPKRL